MTTFKKKDFVENNIITENQHIDELVGGDINSGGGDRNVVSNSEIETGPVQKPFNDNSDYEKGVSTTTDRVTGRYRQNIPWFAIYSYGGSRSGRGFSIPINEVKTIITKKAVEEKIDDLVKKSKNNDVNDKNYNSKVNKVLDIINDCDLTDTQLDDISKAILAKKDNPKTTKKL